MADHLDTILLWACDAFGDITPHVTAHFHAAHPLARDTIEARYPGRLAAIEGQMIEQALYCITQWPVDRQEVEIMLQTAAPQHVDTFGIGPELFGGLFDSLFAVIRQAIPDAAKEQTIAFAELCSDLEAAIHSAFAPAPHAAAQGYP